MSMQRTGSASRFRILPTNRYFEANRRIVEYEIQSSNSVTFFSEVDLTEVEQIRGATVENQPSYTAFVVKSLALALREHPAANRRICRRRFPWFSAPRVEEFTCCDIAVACERNITDAEGLAFADIIRDADQLSLAEITAWLRELGAADCQTNKQWRDFSSIITRFPQWISSRLIRWPCFSAGLWAKYRGGAALISSPAKYGVDGVVATWSWPLGISFGYVKQRPIVRDGRVEVGKTFLLSLNFDRRLLAGAPAARFFHRIVELLENAQTALGAPSGIMGDAISAHPERVLQDRVV